ncbi:DUF429 domain-containing protein [Bacillus sp. FJAT-42376]|uniref:DUF429 domain-containing protein n=1 Tax=Bacillus sp. FJAT-42376 TaxID=2014076 RepID=UPI0013DD894E|nr:DUF429 domain-containing protein [Bacillus sp. FJAT-42376]
MFVLGVDLSGPSNHKDTAAALFHLEGKDLNLLSLKSGLSDSDILEIVSGTAGAPLAAGLDAPLSYNDGGGDRPSDSWFRKELSRHGLRPSSIMPPTLTRMVYLTVRGISLASMMERVKPGVWIAEVHPGAALMTRLSEKEKEHGLLYKKSDESRSYLIDWFRTQHIHGVTGALSTHETDAVAAAMAVRDWILAQPKAFFPKEPPHHPYDLLC